LRKAIDLLKKMVFFFPQARISAAKALEHKYFDEFIEKDESPNLPIEEEAKKEALPIFETKTKLKLHLKITPIQEYNRSESIDFFIKLMNF